MSGASPRVLIIGAGIAGPVLGVFLKLHGFDPIIYEKNVTVEAGGISLVLQPNGLKVLDLIPNALNRIPGIDIDRVRINSILRNGTLADNRMPTRLREKTGYAMRGVIREDFHKWIVQLAREEYGIEIRWGCKLASIIEDNDDGVEVVFENGEMARGMFVVGCDGLHSRTRTLLFGEDEPRYLGLSQTSGRSPITPWVKENMGGKTAMYNYFGVACHMVAYHVGSGKIAWFVTRRIPENKESWKQILNEEEMAEIKRSPFAEWLMGAGELVQSAEKFVKYGLYERPNLEAWYKGRVVLLGDAAHPMPPHVGQGANQAFEDIYHLVKAFKTYNIASDSSTDKLQRAFQEYQDGRMERARIIVERSKFEGEKMRAVEGVEACERRDEVAEDFWQEDKALGVWGEFGNYPFVGESAL